MATRCLSSILTALKTFQAGAQPAKTNHQSVVSTEANHAPQQLAHFLTAEQSCQSMEIQRINDLQGGSLTCWKTPQDALMSASLRLSLKLQWTGESWFSVSVVENDQDQPIAIGRSLLWYGLRMGSPGQDQECPAPREQLRRIYVVIVSPDKICFELTWSNMNKHVTKCCNI
eukprot:6049604-Amphidinium_carterae.1